MNTFRMMTVGLSLAAGLVALGGCAEKKTPEWPTPVAARSANLLFGTEPSYPLSTRYARGDWPSVSGPIESPEETNYIEYYFDRFGGNAAQESNNPRRYFRSFSYGSQFK